MADRPLAGRTALVTGASRGVGKGVALGLAEAGATVFFTGRTVEEGTAASRLPGTIFETAAEIEALGAEAHPIRCDHRDDDQVRAVFERIASLANGLDILVNNAWGGYEHYTDGTDFASETGFWTMPLARWDAMFDGGVRTQYTASVLAVPLLLKRIERAGGNGLIVNISFFTAGRYDRGVIYGTAKRASDHMAASMAHELGSLGIAAVSLYPGLVRTESVLQAGFDLENSESPQFVGRAVAALAGDVDVMARSGQALVAAALAREYGFTDINGSRPRPLSEESV